jgi:hypothetical protein
LTVLAGFFDGLRFRHNRSILFCVNKRAQETLSQSGPKPISP